MLRDDFQNGVIKDFVKQIATSEEYKTVNTHSQSSF